MARSKGENDLFLLAQAKHKIYDTRACGETNSNTNVYCKNRILSTVAQRIEN